MTEKGKGREEGKLDTVCRGCMGGKRSDGECSKGYVGKREMWMLRSGGEWEGEVVYCEMIYCRCQRKERLWG